MKKTAFSLIAILALSPLSYAGGNITPVEEPVVETPALSTDANTWQNEISIYGWLASVSATTPFPDSGGSSVDASDIIDNLEMVFMGMYAARYNKWSVIADVVYMDVGNSKDKTLTFPDETVSGTVNMDIKALLVNAGVGYNIVDTEKGILDIIAGVRYLDLEVDVSTDALLHREISGSDSLTDIFVGMRGYYDITKQWYLPYEADIGTGDSQVSYQLFAGIGYRYSWGDVKLGYRYLGYDMEDNRIVEDLDLSGAVLGVSFRF